jgi:glycosyltransferase involved in cell wall biosynthesis
VTALRVTVVVPFVNLTGGIRMVLERANALHERGHQITVVYPSWPYRFHLSRRQQWREYLKTRASPVAVPWFQLRADLLRVPRVRSAFLPEADLVLATSWPTAYDVAGLAPSCGRKVHLVMHHESGTGRERRIRRIYRLPLYRITLARSVQEDLRASFGCVVDAVVPDGVNPRTFFPQGRPSGPSVLMLYHPDPRKGARDGLLALSLLRERLPGVRVRVCGTVRPEALPPWASFWFHPGDDDLRGLYSTSTAFLYPSRYEGFGLPPLEAMACACPVVTTRVGAVPEYAVDGRDALVVEPGDVGGMADRLYGLLRHPWRRERLVANGLRRAAQYSLARSAACFEQALREALEV